MEVAKRNSDGAAATALVAERENGIAEVRGVVGGGGMVMERGWLSRGCAGGL